MSSQRTDPATPAQVRFVGALMKEAHRRGHISQPDNAQEVYDAIMAYDPTTTWHVLGPSNAVNTCQLDARSGIIYYGGKSASVGDVGRFIDMLLTWMPDKKPKGKPSAKPKGEWTANPAPLPVANPQPNIPTAESVVEQVMQSGQPSIIIVIPLDTAVSEEAIRTAADLVDLFLQTKTSLPIPAGTDVRVTQVVDEGVMGDQPEPH